MNIRVTLTDAQREAIANEWLSKKFEQVNATGWTTVPEGNGVTDMRDDPSPVTPDALRAMGFTDYGGDGLCLTLCGQPLWVGKDEPFVQYDVQGPNHWWYSDGHDEEVCFALPDLPTLGRVRQLVAALGLTPGEGGG